MVAITPTGTASGSLPANATETGTFYMQPLSTGSHGTPISFPVPLEGELAEGKVHAVNPAGEEYEPVSEEFVTAFLERPARPSG